MFDAGVRYGMEKVAGLMSGVLKKMKADTAMSRFGKASVRPSMAKGMQAKIRQGRMGMAKRRLPKPVDTNPGPLKASIGDIVKAKAGR